MPKPAAQLKKTTEIAVRPPTAPPPTFPTGEGFALPTATALPQRELPSRFDPFGFNQIPRFAGKAFSFLEENVFQPLQLALDPAPEVVSSLIDVGVEALAERTFGEGLGLADPERRQEQAEQLERSRQTLSDVGGFLTGRGDLSGPELAGALRGRFQKRDLFTQVAIGAAVDPAAALAVVGPAVRGVRAAAEALKITRSTRLPTQAAQNIFDLQAITPGLNTRQMVSNAFKQSLAGKPINVNMILDDPMAVASNAERLRIGARVESVAGAFSGRFGAQANAVFDVDDAGRIAGDLAGIDPSLPGNPTIQDIAARLPLYRDALSPEALKFFEDIKEALRPIQELMGEVGIEVGLRADVIDGGFYIPRGNALEEGVDLPFKLGGRGRTGGGKTGAERAATFDSMAEGIESGWEYSTIEQTLNGFVSNVGRRVADQHIVNFWKNAVDPTTGEKIAQTLADRVPGGLKTQVQQLRNKIRSRRVTLQNQTVRVTEQVNTAARAGRAGGEAAERTLLGQQRVADRAGQFSVQELNEVRSDLRVFIDEARGMALQAGRNYEQLLAANRNLTKTERLAQQELIALGKELDELEVGLAGLTPTGRPRTSRILSQGAAPPTTGSNIEALETFLGRDAGFSLSPEARATQGAKARAALPPEVHKVLDDIIDAQIDFVVSGTKRKPIINTYHKGQRDFSFFSTVTEAVTEHPSIAVARHEIKRRLVSDALGDNPSRLLRISQEQLRIIKGEKAPSPGIIKSDLSRRAMGLENRALGLHGRVDKLFTEVESAAIKVEDITRRSDDLKGLTAAEKAEYISAQRVERISAQRQQILKTAERELRMLVREQSRLDRAATIAERRGLKTSIRQIGTVDEIARLEQNLADVGFKWKLALEKARQTPSDMGSILLGGLEGTVFPLEIANSAQKIMDAQGRLTGAQAALLNTANAFNNLYRAVRATFDDSVLGIQGLFGLGAAPKAYRAALKVNLLAWGRNGDAVLGKFIWAFDEAKSAAGRLTSTQWATYGIRVGGANTEFRIGEGALKRLGNLPILKEANRAFGYFGDALRLGWADEMLKSELAAGRTMAEMAADGTLRDITKTINNMTGWTEGKAFGTMGDLMLFAPRFLQSRANTLADAMLGATLGADATLAQRQARNSLLKLIGWTTMMTVAINEIRGYDTDFRVFVNGRKNPNFNRIRNFGGRDISLLGTWDSFAGAIINVGQGRPDRALRSLGSGLVANVWDFASGTDAIGRPVRDNFKQAGLRLLENIIPFSTQELPSIGIGTGKAVAKGDIGEAAAGVTNIALEIIGTKSSPLTVSERLAEARGFTTEQFRDVPFTEQKSINNLPEVQTLLAERQKQALERSSGFAAFREAGEAIDKKYDDPDSGLIPRAAEELGHSRAFREQLSKLQSDRSLEKDGLKDRHIEDLEFFKDLAPSTNLENLALDAYIDKMFAPELEDPATGIYDFEERNKRENDLRKEFGDEQIDKIQDFLNTNAHSLQRELREDREFLEDYWSITQSFVEAFKVAPEYRQYLGIIGGLERKIYLVRHPVLAFALTRASAHKRRVREFGDPEIEARLLKWGYVDSPLNPQVQRSPEVQERLQPVEAVAP